MVGIRVTNVLTMLLPLAHCGSSLAIMSPHVGFATTLTPLYVLMGVTTSGTIAAHSNKCSDITPGHGLSQVLLIVFSVSGVHFT